MRKKLKKDIVIPAGTIFNRIPKGSKSQYGKDFFEKSIGLTKDTCGDLRYCVDSDDPSLNEWFEDVD